ncbi:hypothetical protein BaRGS_00027517, partial [Batillaria attramentaria]
SQLFRHPRGPFSSYGMQSAETTQRRSSGSSQHLYARGRDRAFTRQRYNEYHRRWREAIRLTNPEKDRALKLKQRESMRKLRERKKLERSLREQLSVLGTRVSRTSLTLWRSGTDYDIGDIRTHANSQHSQTETVLAETKNVRSLGCTRPPTACRPRLVDGPSAGCPGECSISKDPKAQEKAQWMRRYRERIRQTDPEMYRVQKLRQREAMKRLRARRKWEQEIQRQAVTVMMNPP